ncbi:hypothetical protein QVA66_08515 [Staphylococcus chromogenes]|nr:hypothetical protein [Staphylococcus chromogenes]
MNINSGFARRVLVAGVAVATVLSASGCTQLGHKLSGLEKTADSQTESGNIKVSETPKPVFKAQQVPLKTDQDPNEAVKDDGLNVEWKIIAAVSGPSGGTVFKVQVKNLDTEVAAPPAEINKFKLVTSGNNNVSRMKNDEEGLDLPLGPGATTVINVSFNTSPYNLSNAKLTLGNVEFAGYLNL